MRINTYLQKLKEVNAPSEEADEMNIVDAIKNVTDIWSNDACQGYFIKAAQSAGLNQSAIQKVLQEFHRVFKEISVDRAAEIYREF